MKRALISAIILAACGFNANGQFGTANRIGPKGSTPPAACSFGQVYNTPTALNWCNEAGIWAALGTGTVGGASTLTTVGAIPYVTSSGTLGQAQVSGGQLFWDATNKRLGIGTTSPAEKVDVSGNVLVQQPTNLSSIIYLNPNSSVLGRNYQWLITGGNSTNAYRLDFGQSDAPYLTILNSAGGGAGNVGIGTTSPAAKLDVKGNAIIYDSTATVGTTTLTVKAGANQGTTNLQEWNSNSGTVAAAITSAGGLRGSGIALNDFSLYFTSKSSALGSDAAVKWSNTVDASATKDLGIARDAAGVLKITDGSTGLGKLNAAPGGSVPSCSKYTVAYSTLTDADTQQDVTLFNLPARGKITGLTIKHSTAFAATGLTALTTKIGWSGDSQFYGGPFDISTVVSDTNFTDDGGHASASHAAHNVVARFDSTGANLNTLSAGSVDVWACWVVLP